jgi:hypothetical protein
MAIPDSAAQWGPAPGPAPAVQPCDHVVGLLPPARAWSATGEAGLGWYECRPIRSVFEGLGVTRPCCWGARDIAAEGQWWPSRGSLASIRWAFGR